MRDPWVTSRLGDGGAGVGVGVGFGVGLGVGRAVGLGVGGVGCSVGVETAVCDGKGEGPIEGIGDADVPGVHVAVVDGVAVGDAAVGGGDVVDAGGVDPAGPPTHAPRSAVEATTASSQRHRCKRDEVPIAPKLGRTTPGAHGVRAGIAGLFSPKMHRRRGVGGPHGVGRRKRPFGMRHRVDRLWATGSRWVTMVSANRGVRRGADAREEWPVFGSVIQQSRHPHLYLLVLAAILALLLLLVSGDTPALSSWLS